VKSDLAGMLRAAVLHHQSGEAAEAERLCREVLAIDQRQSKAAFLLGVIALGSARVDEAIAMFKSAAALEPREAVFRMNLGTALRKAGRLTEAAAALRKAIQLNPESADARYHMGVLQAHAKDPDVGLASFEKAAQLKLKRQPGPLAVALAEIGMSAGLDGEPEGALAVLRRAIEHDASLAGAHCEIGNVLAQLGRHDDALASYRRALQLDPGLSRVHNNMGRALLELGNLEEAIASDRRALATSPGDAAIHSNLVFHLHFDPRCDARGILEEARRWAERHAAPLGPRMAPHASDRAPERRLRVGYVSPDFRRHANSFFFLPLLAAHDRERFEIFCYASVGSPDAVTDDTRRRADHWRSVASLSDAELAAAIERDRIDVLVDLTMHAKDGRLLVFARRPAPVQIAWLAYPGTTGLPAIDYRITDPFLDPPGSDDASAYSETCIRLPDTFWCYDPLGRDVASGPLPARSSGRVTFGCLNHFVKLSEGAIALWSRVLREEPGSRLVLMVGTGSARERTLARFEAHGVAAERIELVGRQGAADYLATYQRIDVCLDTLPYNGHTTSLDALWMGVPVVTLVGATVVGRAGLSQAMNLGLPELVARTPDELVAIAVGLARDLERLGALRASLRARMERSPLMDAPRFARNIEAAYRDAWRRWCARPGA
jgi:predicted O-linked N-acetylglucosamine transferase (SPINDLY family)